MGLLDKAGFTGLVSSGGGLLGSIFNNVAQFGLAKWQNQQNLKMWNLQNEYNSPAAQMQRFKDAGLNPNLIYGNGSASAGNASTSPTVTAPNFSSTISDSVNSALSTYLSALGAYQNIKKTNQEIEESQTRSAVNRANELYLSQKRINETTQNWLNTLRGRQMEFDYQHGLKLEPYQLQYQGGLLRAQEMNILQGLADLRSKQQIYNHYEVMNPLLQDQLRFDIVPKRYRANMIQRNGYDPNYGVIQGGLSVIADGINKGVDSWKQFGNKASSFFKNIYNNWKPDKNVYHPY